MNDEQLHWFILISISICLIIAMLSLSACTTIEAEMVIIDQRANVMKTNGLTQAQEFEL